jgi:hypothetical protein
MRKLVGIGRGRACAREFDLNAYRRNVLEKAWQAQSLR